ncbi:recombinase family protein [Tabrizicola sp. M-4]|uniref:recombinase family protein n=1 Tax=Tabrizicola sp. M-4 TaxID=3055847 RepID=UPI003DA835DE
MAVAFWNSHALRPEPPFKPCFPRPIVLSSVKVGLNMVKQARTTRKPRAIVGYVRVSTDRQRTDGISLDLQRAAIRDFARRADLPLVEIFEDVASGAGSKSFPSRLGLQRALEACREFDAVLVVWDWSRLSRHAASEKMLKDLLPGTERVASLKEAETLSDASKNSRLAHAEEQRNEISRRTKRAMSQRKDDGAVFGNPKIRSVHKSGTKVAKEKSDAIIREIMDFLKRVPNASAVTRQQVVEHLNMKGVRTLHGNPMDITRVTIPLRKARVFLAKEAAEEHRSLQKNPDFGRF